MRKIPLGLALVLAAAFGYGSLAQPVGPGPAIPPCTAFGTTSGTCLQGAGALGTPSSGVGTNITGVNAATLGGATFASPSAIGSVTPSAGTFNGLTASTATITSAVNITIASATGFRIGGMPSDGTISAWGIQTGTGTIGSGNTEYINIYKDASGWEFNTSKGGSGTTRAMNWMIDDVIKMTLATSGNISFVGQIVAANMTQTSAAQSGTVCWAAAGITYDATLGCLASLPELKTFHGEITGALAKLSQMKSYWASWRKETPEWTGGDHEIQPVFNARQIALVDKRLVSYGPDGKLRGVRYAEVSAFLAAALNEEREAREALQADVAAMRSMLDVMKRNGLREVRN